MKHALGRHSILAILTGVTGACVLVLGSCAENSPSPTLPAQSARAISSRLIGNPVPTMTEEGCQLTPGCWQGNANVGFLDDGIVSTSLNESPFPDPAPGADGIWLGIAPSDCYLHLGQATTAFTLDADEDDLSDECEYRLIKAFVPMLSYAAGEECRGGEPYWIAKYIDDTIYGTGDMVKLGYLMAYYDDCGSFGHSGDSEFNQLTVVYNYSTQHWELVNAWLSEHACTDFSVECLVGSFITHTSEWGANFEFPAGRVKSFPRIYASKNKHANYHSLADCNAGGGAGTDTCVGATDVGRFKIWQTHNLGSFHHKLLDCVGSQSGLPNLTATECLWTGDQFGGWQGLEEQSSGYYNPLLSLAFQATIVSATWWWSGSYGY